jgi:glycosyltransferase involved in cell wall biosynthesis
VSGARNHGLRLATGEFVSLLDSDDIWFPWKIAAQLAVFRAFPEAGMVWTDMEAIDPDGRVFNPRYLKTMYSAYRWFGADDLFERSIRLGDVSPDLPEPARSGFAYVGDIHSQMIMGNLVHTSTVLIRRERQQRVGEFLQEYTNGGEDYHFHLRTCREGPVAFVDLPAIQYQRGMPDRITRPESRLKFARSFLKTINTELAEHGTRIKLPPAMIRDVVSEAHAWIGDAALDQGQRWLALRHFVASLAINPAQARTWRLLCLASVPQFVGDGLRKLKHRRQRPPARNEATSGDIHIHV